MDNIKKKTNDDKTKNEIIPPNVHFPADCVKTESNSFLYEQKDEETDVFSGIM